MDTFYKIVPQELLPKEYGGTAEASTVLAGKKTNSTFTHYILKNKIFRTKQETIGSKRGIFQRTRATNK